VSFTERKKVPGWGNLRISTLPTEKKKDANAPGDPPFLGREPLEKVQDAGGKISGGELRRLRHSRARGKGLIIYAAEFLNSREKKHIQDGQALCLEQKKIGRRHELEP